MQQRAIETKEKLMNAALELYLERDYHTITVDEVAKKAELSTGIAYRYFKNKKELLLASLEYAVEDILNQADTQDVDFLKFVSTYDLANYLLTWYVSTYRDNHEVYEIIEGLKRGDEEIRELYDKLEERTVERIFFKTKQVLPGVKKLPERVLMVVGMMRGYCTITLNDRQEGLDYDFIRHKTIEEIVETLTH
ncbi:MAG: TetR/AcrR family transcriptional regulator [Lachnospiraceae bacterium]|nr:TetR/AcrR family transcriptional regulator [Lachnospiraceae bacterium]